MYQYKAIINFLLMEFYKTKKTLTELGYCYRDNGYYNPAKCGDKYFIQSPRITELGYTFTRDYNGMTGYIRDKKYATRNKQDVIMFLFGKTNYKDKQTVNNAYTTCVTCGQIVPYVTEYEKNKKETEQQILNYKTVINENNNAISALQGQLNSAHVCIARVKNTNEDWKERLLSLENEKQKIDNELKKVQAEKEMQLNKIVGVTNELEQSRSIIKRLEEDNIHLKNQLVEKGEEISLLCFENCKIQDELQQLYIVEIGIK